MGGGVVGREVGRGPVSKSIVVECISFHRHGRYLGSLIHLVTSILSTRNQAL